MDYIELLKNNFCEENYTSEIDQLIDDYGKDSLHLIYGTFLKTQLRSSFDEKKQDMLHRIFDFSELILSDHEEKSDIIYHSFMNDFIYNNDVIKFIEEGNYPLLLKVIDEYRSFDGNVVKMKEKDPHAFDYLHRRSRFTFFAANTVLILSRLVPLILLLLAIYLVIKWIF